MCRALSIKEYVGSYSCSLTERRGPGLPQVAVVVICRPSTWPTQEDFAIVALQCAPRARNSTTFRIGWGIAGGQLVNSQDCVDGRKQIARNPAPSSYLEC